MPERANRAGWGQRDDKWRACLTHAGNCQLHIAAGNVGRQLDVHLTGTYVREESSLAANVHLHVVERRGGVVAAEIRGQSTASGGGKIGPIDFYPRPGSDVSFR